MGNIYYILPEILKLVISEGFFTSALFCSKVHRRKPKHAVGSNSTKRPTLEDALGKLYIATKTATVWRYASLTTGEQVPVESDMNVLTEEVVETSTVVPPPISELVRIHSETLPVFSKEQCEAIEETTRLQSNCIEWHRQRSMRISGSTIHRIMNAVRHGRVSESTINVITKEEQRPLNNIPSIKYGRDNELKAIEDYKKVMVKKHKNFIFSRCGMFVSKSKIFYLCYT